MKNVWIVESDVNRFTINEAKGTYDSFEDAYAKVKKEFAWIDPEKSLICESNVSTIVGTDRTMFSGVYCTIRKSVSEN